MGKKVTNFILVIIDINLIRAGDIESRRCRLKLILKKLMLSSRLRVDIYLST